MSIQILSDFKNNLIKFFDELAEQFPTEGDLVIIRILLKDRIPIHEVMTYFIKEILRDKPKIKSRDDTFFTEGKSLFGMLPEAQANTFKRIWRSPQLDKDDRIVIWQWTDLFVALSEKYQKLLILV
jgi:hypothetical protein